MAGNRKAARDSYLRKDPDSATVLLATMIRSLALLATLILSPGTLAAGPVRSGHAEAELVGASTHVQPGSSALVGLSLTIDPGWHAYWINPGDSGAPPEVEWDLPDGFSASPLQFPVPKTFETGGLVGYGYEGRVILLAEIQVPGSFAGESVTLKATASWLLCDPDTCVPGDAELELTLPVKQEKMTPGPQAEAMAAEFRKVPTLSPAKPSIALEGDHWDIRVSDPRVRKILTESPTFLPESENFAASSPPPKLEATDDGYHIRAAVSANRQHLENPVRFLLKTDTRAFIFIGEAK